MTKTNHKDQVGDARLAAAVAAATITATAAPRASHARRRTGEHGYALVALLALMAILALAMTAAAPSLRQQSQRMLEQEAIYRGQEVAEAIDQYRRYTNNLPTSMDDLIKGVQVPGRINKVYLLRPSATRDPLTKSGEWKVVRANDREWREFQEGLQKYVGQVPITSLASDQYYVTKNLITAFTGVIDVKQTEKGDCGEDTAPNGTGEFIGVTSRSRCSSVLTFYGIDRHDRWVFTPVFK